MGTKQLLMTVAAGLPLSVVFADLPPTAVKPAVEIVEQLEKMEYGPFIEVSFDDGYWEVEAYKNELPYELVIDGRSGKVLSERRDDAEPRPASDAQPLSKVLQTLIKAGYNNIDEIAFERTYWEIEVWRLSGNRELQVDPKTGEVLSDRLDD